MQTNLTVKFINESEDLKIIDITCVKKNLGGIAVAISSVDELMGYKGILIISGYENQHGPGETILDLSHVKTLVFY